MKVIKIYSIVVVLCLVFSLLFKQYLILLLISLIPVFLNYYLMPHVRSIKNTPWEIPILLFFIFSVSLFEKAFTRILIQFELNILAQLILKIFIYIIYAFLILSRIKTSTPSD